MTLVSTIISLVRSLKLRRPRRRVFTAHASSDSLVLAVMIAVLSPGQLAAVLVLTAAGVAVWEAILGVK